MVVLGVAASMWTVFYECNTTGKIFDTHQGALWNPTSSTIASFKAACNNKEGYLFDDALCEAGNAHFKEEHPAAYAGATAIDYTIPSTYLGYAAAATAATAAGVAYKEGCFSKSEEIASAEGTPVQVTIHETPSKPQPVKKTPAKSWFEEYWIVLGSAVLCVLLAVAAVLFFCCKKKELEDDEEDHIPEGLRISQV